MPSEKIDLPPLPQPDTASLAYSGRDIEYMNGYESGFESAVEKMQAYARLAVEQERERCIAIVSHIYETTGEWEDVAELSAAAIRKG